MVPMSFNQHNSTLVLSMMKGMSYMPGLGLGRRQQWPREFAFTIDHDIPYGLGYTPSEDDARHMAMLHRDRVRACLFGVPFDYPFRPYTFQLTDYFTRGSEHASHTEGVDHVSKMAEIRGIQQALRQMCLSSKTTEPPEAMIVAPPSPDRASVFSMCFPEEVPDYDLPMDLGDDIDGVTLPDTYMDEMDMIGTGRILDTAPCGPHYAFDMFGVSMINTDDVTLYDACTDAMDMIGTSRILDASSPRRRSAFDVFGISMLEFDGDGLVATDITHDTVSVEGASDSVDPPLSFYTMSGFVTRFDDISDGNNDMSIFEYLLVSQHFPLIAPPAPIAHICDVDDVGDTDDPLGGKSESNSDTEDRKVTPVSGNTELIDFGVPDQPKEIKIGYSLSPDERSGLIDLLRSYLDVFAWSYEDMPGLDPTIVQHHLPILPHARPVKQKLRRLHPRWSLQVKEEIQKQLSVGFLSVVEYPEWLMSSLFPKRMEKLEFVLTFEI